MDERILNVRCGVDEENPYVCDVCCPHLDSEHRPLVIGASRICRLFQRPGERLLKIGKNVEFQHIKHPGEDSVLRHHRCLGFDVRAMDPDVRSRWRKNQDGSYTRQVGDVEVTITGGAAAYYTWHALWTNLDGSKGEDSAQHPVQRLASAKADATEHAAWLVTSKNIARALDKIKLTKYMEP